MRGQEADRPSCAFVGDQSLVVRCVEIAREAGLSVDVVASHNPDVLEAVAGEGTELIELSAPADLAPALAGRRFDALFSVAYLHIVPDAVLEQAEIALNFHDGPLPDYAGIHVTSWAIANGETSHGVTWHHMTSDVDRGDIAAEAQFAIEPIDTALSLNARCFEAGAQTFVEVAQSVASGTVPKSRQPDRDGRMYLRRQRPTVVVDPTVPAAEIERSIRALHVGDRVVNAVGSAHLLVDGHAYVVTEAGSTGATGRALGSVSVDASGTVSVATVDGELILRDVRSPDGHVAHLDPAQIALPGDLTQALAEHDPSLHDHENWWRNELAVSVADTSLDELDESRNVQSAIVETSADLSTVAAALSFILASRSESDVISLAVSDVAATKHLDSLGPLLAPAQCHASVDLDESISAYQLRVGQAVADALAHGPFLRDLIDRDPALRTNVVPPVAHLRIGAAENAATVGSGLVVSMHEGQIELQGRADEPALRNLAQQLVGIIEKFQSSPESALGSIELTTSADDEVLAALNATALAESDKTIDQQFRDCADQHGDQSAVSCAGVTIKYAELVERVDTIATRLGKAGVQSGDVVGIALERSIDLAASVLAVLSVGATYLPLDLDYPTDRLQFMIDDSGTSVVLGRNDIITRFSRGLTVLDPADTTPDTDDFESAPQRSVADLAYVIYTSGSTGTPKGVQLEHRQVANFFVGMDAVINDEDRGVWLAVTSLSFDISVLELLWTLTRGFHVVIKQTTGFQPVRSFASNAPSMSLFHFAASDTQAGQGYRLLLESSKWGDEKGFEAVWTPERHFHDFGAPYPNPSVVAAAVAAVTERIHIRAGSVVLPLHSPVRVAEEWSVVDNLSNGRVGISFAAGWQPDDFVLNPTGYANAKEELPQRIEAVRNLWRGEAVELPGPDGDPVTVRTLPRPIQDELPVWLTSAGSPESFERAGTLGVNLLTHLLGQTIEQLDENIARYRAARQAAGHTGSGKVTLMLHTFLGDDGETARETARDPLIGYLGTAVGLIKSKASMFPTFAGTNKDADDAFSSLDDDDVDQLLAMAADRYLSTSGLFGTVDDALDMMAKVSSVGVDEVACLIDFGIDADVVLQSLDLLGQVHDRLQDGDGEIETVASLVERHQVSHLQCTPSLASMLVSDPAERAALGELHHMMVGGEALPTELAADLRQIVPGRVTNMYGPTETTIWSLTHDLPETTTGVIPIGTPIANTTVHIMDRHRRSLPIGVFGELFIGGAGVARGYLNRPELNSERFVDLPEIGRVYATGDIARVGFDGVVEFAGRSDGQVKIRGHRIELGEIEAVLDRHEAVARSVVVAGGAAEPTLRAFVVPASSETPDLDLIATYVAESLPAAMVPSRFESIARLPFTPNGKVDRNRLAELSQSSSGTSASDEVAAEGTEATVAAVWRDQLGRDVGRSDNFFDIGGHSLMAVNVFRALSTATGASISLTDVFRYPTVELFAAHLDRQLGGAETTEAPPASSAGSDRGSRRRQALARRGRGE